MPGDRMSALHLLLGKIDRILLRAVDDGDTIGARMVGFAGAIADERAIRVGDWNVPPAGVGPLAALRTAGGDPWLERIPEKWEPVFGREYAQKQASRAASKLYLKASFRRLAFHETLSAASCQSLRALARTAVEGSIDLVRRSNPKGS